MLGVSNCKMSIGVYDLRAFGQVYHQMILTSDLTTQELILLFQKFHVDTKVKLVNWTAMDMGKGNLTPQISPRRDLKCAGCATHCLCDVRSAHT